MGLKWPDFEITKISIETRRPNKRKSVFQPITKIFIKTSNWFGDFKYNS